MAFTRTWDSSDPQGTLDANLLDNSIREMKEDIEERMDELLGEEGAWLADPLMSAARKTMKRRISWIAGQIIGQPAGTQKAPNQIYHAGSDGEMQISIPLILPVGASLTKVDAVVLYRNADHTINCTVVGRNRTTTTFTVSLSAPSETIAPQIVTWTGTQTIIDTDYYYFNFYSNNNTVDNTDPLGLNEIYIEYTLPNLALR